MVIVGQLDFQHDIAGSGSTASPSVQRLSAVRSRSTAHQSASLACFAVRRLGAQRLGAQPDKKIVDSQAAIPSS